MNLKLNFILISCLFIMTACMNSNYSLEPEKSQPMELTKLSSDLGIPDQQASNQAKQILSNYDEVQGVRAVNHNKQLLIGVKLKHHDRLQLDQLERDLRKKIKRNFSEMTITLSTDEKIHLEVKKLEKAMLNNELKEKELEKRIEKIRKLSKEET